jgi:choline dehydrogenase-like flavoprotein
VQGHDADFVIVGSGFGGSVAALRLAEKGYSVIVLESGRRIADDEFPRNTADLRRYAAAIPHATTTILADTGHVPMVDAPDAVARLILDAVTVRTGAVLA